MLLLALFVAEAFIFYQQVERYIAPFYPPNFDQLSYYLATYDLIHAIQARGFRAIVDELFLPSSATGTTFVLQGALLSFVGGANRTALLSLNLLYLLGVQFTFFQTIRARTGDVYVAWIGLALLISLSTLFLGLGGVYDYRIDFSALCLYGIWCCLVIWSGVFRNSTRTFVVSVVGILLIISRFFTIIYVGAVYGGLLLAAIATVWLSRSLPRRLLAWRRIRNILISGVFVLVVCLARLFVSWRAIYDYYVVGHMLGEERFIRAHELGIFTFVDHLWYYPHSILVTHIGSFALWVGGSLMVLSLAAALAARTRPLDLLESVRGYGLDFLALGLSTLVPLAILTINVAKSPVVGGIVVVPIALAIALFCAALLPRNQVDIPLLTVPTWTSRHAWLRSPVRHLRVPVAALLAIVAIAASLQHFVTKAWRPARPPRWRGLKRSRSSARRSQAMCRTTV